jgi:hypothetical protein
VKEAGNGAWSATQVARVLGRPNQGAKSKIGEAAALHEEHGCQQCDRKHAESEHTRKKQPIIGHVEAPSSISWILLLEGMTWALRALLFLRALAPLSQCQFAPAFRALTLCPLGTGKLQRQFIKNLGSDRPYQSGRSKQWVKVKNRQHPAMSRVMEAFG